MSLFLTPAFATNLFIMFTVRMQMSDERKSVYRLHDSMIRDVRWTFTVEVVRDLDLEKGDKFVCVEFKSDDDFSDVSVTVDKIWLVDQCDSSSYTNLAQQVNGFLPKLLYREAPKGIEAATKGTSDETQSEKPKIDRHGEIELKIPEMSSTKQGKTCWFAVNVQSFFDIKLEISVIKRAVNISPQP